jgi:hypothetical protein
VQVLYNCVHQNCCRDMQCVCVCVCCTRAWLPINPDINIKLTWIQAVGRTRAQCMVSAQALASPPIEGLGPTASSLVSFAALLQVDLTWGTSPATITNDTECFFPCLTATRWPDALVSLYDIF